VRVVARKSEGGGHPPSLVEAYAGALCRIGYREEQWKVRLTFSAAISPLDTETVEVFDLEADPREMRPIRRWDAATVELVDRARRAAQARWQVWPDRRLATADDGGGDEALEQLEALGYVQ